MQSGYKANGNGNNSSKNSNGNYQSLHPMDNGYNYMLGGMKLLSPSWGDGDDIARTRAAAVHSTRTNNNNSNMSRNPNKYYNMEPLLLEMNTPTLGEGSKRSHYFGKPTNTDMLQYYQMEQSYCQRQKLVNCQQLDQQQLTKKRQQQQQLQKSSSPPNYRKYYSQTKKSTSPMKKYHDDFDVQKIKRNLTNNNQQEYRQHSLEADKLLDNNSSDLHYQHYYSYYYDRSPTVPKEKKLGRKLPSTSAFMSAAPGNKPMLGLHDYQQGDSLMNTHLVSPNNKNKYLEPDMGEGKSRMQHVLKENNNILEYENEWHSAGGHVNEIDIIDAADDFIDVKDVDDDYEQKMYSTKRKIGTRLQANKYSAAPLASRQIDAAVAVKKCNRIEKRPVIESSDSEDDDDIDNNDDSASDDDHHVVIQRTIKLPLTPNKMKMANAVGKKPSPPAHRVLLYSSQSPRLPRLSASTLRLQELRRNRNKQNPVLGGLQTDRTKQNSTGVRLCPIIPPTANFDRLKAGGDNNNGNVAIDDCSSNNDDDDIDDLDIEFGEHSPTSSDSDDGYRAHAYKMAHNLNALATHSSITPSQTSQSSEDSLVNPTNLLVPSLFPNVPPYLAFSSNTRMGPAVPSDLYRVLKWRVTSVMPKVVRLILSNSGMRLLKKTNDWMGVWGKHMKSPCFKTIRSHQKINHLPGSFKIGRKDSCWRNLQKQINKHGKKDFGFMPKTFILPHDLNTLRKNWAKYAQRNVKWIIKPPASARGAGIRVVNRWNQIPKRKPLIVQRYIERPLLINGSKFDLRLYVLVTSINPLRVYLYPNGLARFAAVKYSDKSDTLNDRCMHLTNYSINKFSSNYSKNEDVNACHGHKWTIKSLWTYLANRGVRTDYLWDALRSLVLRTILAGEQSINNMIKMNVESKYSCFELFGFDVLLDADLIPWLLEVNISPSLHSDLPLDAHVKAPLVQGVLNTALYNVPPKLSLEKQKEIAEDMKMKPGPICYDKRMYINYLSRAEKVKHNTFTRKTMEDRDEYVHSILDHLTPDDVRCLIVSEDELARSSPLERIFPTSQTHKYLKYTDTPRYYNRLLDAWENRYGGNRAEGITLLRRYCDDKYHLEVPPAPAKKDSNVDGQTNSSARSNCQCSQNAEESTCVDVK